MVLLECKNLSKNYGKKQALKDINFTIPAGKIIGLLGRNGSGKTTLIKLINNLLTPTTGQILIDNKAPGPVTKAIISYLPERTYLDRRTTIKKTLDFFQDFYKDFNKKTAQKLLKDLDLDEDQKISAMSKGMQEKLQLILVMSRKAKLYILDEPLGGVDPATRDYILDTILKNFNPNASLIISTHLISDIERILDEVIFIDKGQIVLQSDADALRAKYKTSIDAIFRKEMKC
ncbi:ABC transporter ATP-binding protein [Candidatus Saccharibacteria bacterium]|nr:ABC transporter ATP-binding protein [Candidatus Saccharibacteria bacterium]